MDESSRSESVERVPAQARAERKSGPRSVAPGAGVIDRGAVLRTLRPSHQRILDAFMAYGTMTPDELAEKIARSVFYTRPRCSELRAMGLLRPTGEAHRNALSGLKAEVLTAGLREAPTFAEASAGQAEASLRPTVARRRQV